ncbi:MAG: hydrogenase formation protein HypD [Deltaproteobacteria bacterium]|nr:hydrogenase formation protein HypD [Deltaproteobacteria bacterium]
MKYVDELRDGRVAKRLAARIAREARPDRRYRLMEFCGGHTHSLWRYGIVSMLPENVEMIHGPGCPVCVLPIGRLEQAIQLARRPGVTLCTFGDMMRVPARDRRSLLTAKAEGADIRMVYGSADALRFAREMPSREIVFFAIGFETTTPATAVVVKQAEAEGLRNFSVFSNHVLTPSAIDAILAGPIEVDGFVGPGHVSTIIGTEPYERFAREHTKPVVVAGFEPLDLMQSILMLIEQLNEGRHEVENQYTRAVVPSGNAKAIALVEEVFELRPSFEWRGLGTLSSSALRLRERFAAWDAEKRWDIPYEHVADHKACACGDILRGLKRPSDCKIFGTACTPESPVGSCMVSPEGSCAAYFAYGRLLRNTKKKANALDTKEVP